MVISSLSAGGAERVLVLLCQGLTALGHHVSVVTVFGTEGDFYGLPEGVDRVALDVGKTTRTTAERLTANARRIAALRRAVRRTRPDVVISFMTETNVLVLLATLGLRVPVIVTEHSDPRKKRMKRIWKGLRRVTYRRASRVVSVSPGVDDYFAWLPESKRVVIGNPILLSEIRAESGEPLPLGWPHSVIAMGRLEPEKGFDVLVAAFARLAADFPDWGLVILGQGGERDELNSLISEAGLGQRVRLPGVVENPFPTMRRADLFVLPSRTESFGNALVEAVACGLPVIATQCWTRSPEWVRDGVTGLVVPTEDAASLAAALARLMADADLRKRLAVQASKGVERFDLDEISRAWDELLAAVAGGPEPGRGRRG